MKHSGLFGLLGAGLLYAAISTGCIGIHFREANEGTGGERMQIDSRSYHTKKYDKENDLYRVKICERIPTGKPFTTTEEVIIPDYRVESEEPLQEGLRGCTLRVYKKAQ